MRKNREGSGAQAFSWGYSAKTNMARQPGVCPKRHAKLPATIIEHRKCQKVAKMAGRPRESARFYRWRIDSVMFAGGRVCWLWCPTHRAISWASIAEQIETRREIRSNFRSTSIVQWWNAPRDLFAISRRGLLTAALKSVNCDFPSWRR